MKTLARLTTVVFLTVATALGAEPKPDDAADDGEQGITLVIDSAVPGKGLRVFAPKTISASSKDPTTVRFSVMNLHKQEVFLTVQGLQFAGLSYELKRRIDDDLEEVEFGGCCDIVIFPDNQALLKRLHACSYDKAGNAKPCGCSIANITATTGREGLSFAEWIGGTCVVTLPIKGYFRDTGKEFSQTVDVPIRIVK